MSDNQALIGSVEADAHLDNPPMPALLPSTASGTHLADMVASFTWDGNKLESGIGIALSGGGFRAMLFHAGALQRLNELGILSRAARISSVSGGSIAAGYLAYIWGKLLTSIVSGVFERFKEDYVEPILEFSRQKLDVIDVVTGLLPWTSAGEEVAKSYNAYLFDGATLQDLPNSPMFVFCATNYQSGVLWRFSKPYAGDYVVGRWDKPNISLAKAVAASSAFPPFLSPLTLTLPQGSLQDWAQPSASRPPDLMPFRSRVLLADGGVYDNHGLEPIVKRYMTLFVSDGGAPFARDPNVPADPFGQLQRVFSITDNQVRALRRRDLIDRLMTGSAALATAKLQMDQIHPRARFGAYWGIDTDPAALAAPAALPCNASAADHLAHLSTRLSDLGTAESKQLINWGYAICDRSVRAHYPDPLLQGKPGPQWPYPNLAVT
jgi:NTE family protein